MPTTTGLATSFINFSRPGASGGGATVTDRDGKIKWAGHNLLLNSESFDAAAWVKAGTATAAANTALAPNGTTTADTLTFNTGIAVATQNITLLSGVPYTLGMWVRSVSGTAVFRLTYFDGSSSFISSDFTATTTWQLFTHTVTGSGAAGNVGIREGSATAAATLYVWGAHCHRADLGGMQQNPAMGAGMGSYYPTTPRNLLGYTEDFSNAYWTKLSTTATAASVTNPAGLNGASLLYPTSTGTDRATYRNITGVASTPYTLSVYAKANGINFLYFGTLGGGTSPASALAFFDLQNGTRTQVGTAFTSATITAVGNGWYRCTATASPASASLFPVFGLADANNSITVTASGTNGIYLWGAQLSDSASLDTYVPQYGAAVTSAAYYAPRLDFDPVTLAAKGLLVEELRTNLFQQSNGFDTSPWYLASGALTITAAAAVSPDGTTNAFSLANSTGSSALLTQNHSATSGTAYTISIWLRCSSGTVSVTLQTSGVLGTAVTVTTAWQRFSVTATSGTTGTVQNLIVIPANSTVFAYGAQLEAGSFATSYIPNGSAVAGATRTADVASVSTQAFPYSSSAGSIVAAFDSIDATNGIVGDQSGSTALLYSDNRDLKAYNGSSFVFVANNWTLNTVAKGSMAYDAAGRAVCLNGGTVATASGVLQSVTQLDLGRSFISVYLNGHIRQITYIPRRLSNAELQSRTA